MKCVCECAWGGGIEGIPLLSDHWHGTKTRSNLPQTLLQKQPCSTPNHRPPFAVDVRGRSFAVARRSKWGIWYKPSLMTAILWIATIFACVGQPSPFSESTARQWTLFTLREDYQHNETHCCGCQSAATVLNEPPAELHALREGFCCCCCCCAPCSQLSALSHDFQSLTSV